MLITKRKPAGVGEILIEEFMLPMGLTQAALADAMGAQRTHVNELCNNRRAVTAPTALILSKVFGNSPDFWLNVQGRTDLWEAIHSMSLTLRRVATIVGRNPCSARVPLDPLFAFCLQPIQAMKRPVRGPAADGGVRPTWARNPRNVSDIGPCTRRANKSGSGAPSH